MKKYLLSVLLSVSGLSVFAQQGMQVKKFNLTQPVADRQVITDELESLTPKEFKTHPEYGVNPYNAPCTDCAELLNKRTATTRYFIKNGSYGSEFYSQQGYSPIHYKDTEGRWRSIDIRLKQTNQPHLFKAENQNLPVTVDAGLGFSSINRAGDEFKFNNNLELFFVDLQGVETSLGRSDWSNYTAGAEGVKVIDAWPGIDIELKVSEGKVKSDFILKQRPVQTAGKFIIRDYTQLPTSHHFAGIQINQLFRGDFSIENGNGEEAFHIYNAYAWDSNPNSNVDELYYRLSSAGALDIEIPLLWLNSNERSYPVTIDPLVTGTNTLPQASITGSTYNATCWTAGCAYNLPVVVPANCTVSDVLWSFNYQTLGGCNMNVGALDLTYGACRSPSNLINWWYCNMANPGTCNGNNLSVFTDFQSCIPAPQCASYNMNFVMNFYRCGGPGANCSNTCIGAASGWTMTVQGRTVQSNNVTGAQVICQGVTANLNCAGQYGVPPYSILWNPGGLVGSPVSVTPGMTTVYTATITDACGQTATATTTVNVTPIVNPGFTVSPAVICPGTNIVFSALGGNPAINYDWLLPGSNNPTPNNIQALVASYPTSGTYNATLNYNSSGCFSPITQQVIVNPVISPSVSITVSPAGPLCAGECVTFTAVVTNGGSNPTWAWRKNGSLITNTSGNLAYCLFNNNDLVTLDITSNAPCVSPALVTSNAILMQISPIVSPAVTITQSPPNPVCPNTPVTFTATPVNGGLIPTYVWQVNGSMQPSTTSNTFTSSSLANNSQVAVNLTSSLPPACIAPPTAISNIISVNLASTVVPSVSVTASPSGAICPGQSVTFTAVPVNGGVAPVYQWKVNGTNVGTNSSTYTSNTLNNGDIVIVTMASNAPCPTLPSVTSANYVVTVNPTLVPSVTISVSPVLPVCAGTNLTFTAVPVNPGTTPVYQWKVNGVNVGGNSATYSASNLANGDVVTVTLTSNALCVSPTTATSNAINITITPSVAPLVSITASPSGPICAGTNVTFTATPTNGGVNPTYQWYVNATPVGNNATFSSSALVNGDAVSVQMTSSITCASPSAANSNIITMTVNPNLVPSITISSAPASPICAGTSVTFTATPVNGGTTPAYQWHLNGANVGTNATTYTTTALATGDVVDVTLTSNAACISPSTANSNNITYTVNPVLVPSVSITASPVLPVCIGTNVTFTAVPVNPGSNPVYQWKVNGVNVGANSSTYSSTSLANGDLVTVTLTSNATCANPATVTSNTINVTITPIVVPTVTIAANPSGAICAGASVTFTASPTGGGNTPTYQWYVNGNPTGTNSTTFTSTTLANGDAVSAVLTSSLTCASPTTATSNVINITVNPILVPSVTISSVPASPICAGTSVTFTAVFVNGGTTPAYQWHKNGANVGTNSANYTTTTLANGDVIDVTLTSNALCASPTTATSNQITYTVNPILVPSVSITASPALPVCAGANVTFTAVPVNPGTTPVYQWKVNGLNVGANSNTFSSTTLATGDIVTVTLTSNATCVTPTTVNSNAINVTITPVLIPSVGISASPSGVICAGSNVIFTAVPTNGGSTPAYQWQINGVNTGSNSPTFSTTSLNNGDIVTVVLTSNLNCVNPTTATSNSVNMTVNPVVVPSVTIVDNPQGQLCQGTPITFTATPVNEGLAPVYQWKVNGVNVGTNSSTFTYNTPANGEVVTVVLTSSEACPLPANVTSNGIVLSIIPTAVPAVTVTPDVAMPVCDGAPVVFTATPVNGGTTPTYQWYLNGAPVAGETLSTYSYTAVNNDIVTVELTSNAQCANPLTAIATAFVIQSLPYLTPSVTITSSPSGTICVGQTVTFTATPVNGGTSPTYQWIVNSNNVGTNSSTLVSNGILPGDVIELTMTSNYQCLNVPSANSNLIQLQINPPITVTINPTSDIICAYEVSVLTATAVGGDGGPYVFTWDTGENGPTINVSPDLTTTYNVSVTDACNTTPGTASANVQVSVTPIADFTFSPDTGITTIDDVFFDNNSFNASWWTWSFSDGFLLDTSETFGHNFPIPGVYDIKLVATSVDGCVDSLITKINVRDQQLFYVPNAFTPDANGLNEVFMVYTFNLYEPYELLIYNRAGIEVYNSNTDSNGLIYWTGQMHNKGELLPDDVYVYYLYINEPYLNKNRRMTRGTVTMIR